MDDCKEIFALLSDYLNLELPADTCREIEAHIANCPPCVDFVNSLRQTVTLCRQYQAGEKPGPMPESLRRELLAAYRRAILPRD